MGGLDIRLEWKGGSFGCQEDLSLNSDSLTVWSQASNNVFEPQFPFLSSWTFSSIRAVTLYFFMTATLVTSSMLPGMVASYLMFNKSIMVQSFQEKKNSIYEALVQCLGCRG